MPEPEAIPLEPTPRIDMLEFYEAYGPGVLVRLPTGEIVTCKPLVARKVAELMPLWLAVRRPRRVVAELDGEGRPTMKDGKPVMVVIPDTMEEELARLEARTALHSKVAEAVGCDKLLDLLPEELTDLISFFFYLSQPRSGKNSSGNGVATATASPSSPIPTPPPSSSPSPAHAG